MSRDKGCSFRLRSTIESNDNKAKGTDGGQVTQYD